MSETVVDVASSNKYMPGSSEKKRVVMMYLLLGIVFISQSEEGITPFEFAHFKQSLGWWLIFLLLSLINVVLIFIPGLKWIALLVVLLDLIILGLFIKQAWDGKYYLLKQESPLFVFQGVGEWVVSIFNLKLQVKEEFQQFQPQKIMPKNEINNINEANKNSEIIPETVPEIVKDIESENDIQKVNLND